MPARPAQGKARAEWSTAHGAIDVWTSMIMLNVTPADGAQPS
jgi:hypothetical protein